MTSIVAVLVVLLLVAVPVIVWLHILLRDAGRTAEAQRLALIHSAEELAAAKADEERKRERMARAWEREVKRREAMAKQPTEAEAKELEDDAEKAVKE